MARHRFGAGRVPLLRRAVPGARSVELKQALYPRLLPIARDWWTRLGRPTPWPDDLDEWLDMCHAAGQTKSTPILLRYGEGDWNALHRDLYGELVFPLQVVINLNDPGVDHTGGEFLLYEQRPRAQSRGTATLIPHGHGLVFTTRDRPVRVARGWSAAPVRHGVSVIRSGERFTLGAGLPRRGMNQPLFERPRAELGPGAVHLPGWLDLAGQRRLVAAYREWAAGPVPARAAVLPGGHPMSVRTVCLGWHWRPYRYTRTADDVNGARVLDLPDWLGDLGRLVLADAYGDAAAAAYRPDTALVNWYEPTARMGMHQDRDEVAAEPVVSLSVGDSCVFRFGTPQGRGKPYSDVTLASGDAVVFGRESRFAYHGVPRILAGTADPATGLREGRINVTMRVTGLGQVS